eukprot:gene27885-12001_t
MSGAAVSQMMAVISCAPYMQPIFDQLFSATGAQLLVRPASMLLKQPTETCNFLTLSARASTLGQVLLGYIDKRTSVAVLNPSRKAAPVFNSELVEGFVTIGQSVNLGGPRHHSSAS